MLELAAGLTDARGADLTVAIAQEVASGGRRRFDKGGDQFYDQISALHKSVRGTDPDGALYWLARMLDGGCDPLYVARRVVRMAVEDIGLADPRALNITLDAWEAYDRLGQSGRGVGDRAGGRVPGLRAQEQCPVRGHGEAVQDVEHFGTLEVPARFPQRPHQADEAAGARAGVSLRPR